MKQNCIKKKYASCTKNTEEYLNRPINKKKSVSQLMALIKKRTEARYWIRIEESLKKQQDQTEDIG